MWQGGCLRRGHRGVGVERRGSAVRNLLFRWRLGAHAAIVEPARSQGSFLISFQRALRS